MSHSRLSPSSMGRIVPCPGSMSMGERFPEEGRNDAAAEGTASHWIGAELLMNQGDFNVNPGDICPENGLVITQEMIDGAKLYADAVFESLGQHYVELMTAEALQVERKMVIKSIHPQCFGTSDCWYVNALTDTLHVFDYKYGFGIVEPTQNWQLLCYAAGALDELGWEPATITLHIVQPRPFHQLGPVRDWSLSMEEFRGYLARLQQAAAEAMSENPRTFSGKHCQYCKARHACGTLAMAVYSAVDYIGNSQPELMAPEAMAIEYRILERMEQLIKARRAAQQARMIAMLAKGEGAGLGFKLEHGKGRQKWSRPAADIINMGQLMGLDLAAPQEAITPAQAKKLGLCKEILDQFSEIPSTGYNLVPDSGTIAANVFAKKEILAVPGIASQVFGK